MTNQLKPDDELPGTDAQDDGQRIGKWMVVALWIMALGIATVLAQRWLDQRAARHAQIALTASSDGSAGVVLHADRFGHYQASGIVNGQPLEFLVDTGASGISIPASMAARLGLERGWPMQVSTANGSVTVYRTRLESLEIGPLRQFDLRAHINPGMDGEMALLGMSFLRNFELLQRNDTLTIRQP